ncbi:hypothetical protein [Halococcus hamelinensis]|uniref:Uncharacterized protein n=1 Tax=Halococcus hamelinensis 100A6 TaxID=1132509 RepID=M0LZM5_9EURY|nr:hypothetical protein [Halococcus hamelinensis]EMA37565.1 hypothetical protein C447_12627 [Halococcus hamelinensis 100A6]
MRPRRAAVVFLSLLVVAVGTASAHQIQSSRFAAPIPLEFLFGGAGVTVAVTALWVGRTGDVTEFRTWRTPLVIPSRIATAGRYGVKAVFFVGFLVTIGHGLVGPQVEAENVATVFVWSVWIAGLGLFSVLFGSPWRTLSPWRAVYDALIRLEGREIRLLDSYPSWLASWPAFVAFVVGIGILENLTVVPRSPASTAVVVAAYAAVMVLGGIAFGEEWFRRADGLAVLYRLFGRVSPVGFAEARDGYRLRLRPPWAGCTEAVSNLSLVAFVVGAVYTVSFDGFTSTPEYQNLLFGLRDLLDSGPTTSVLIYVIGLGGFLVAFVAVSIVMTQLSARESTWRETALAFAPTVVPIAAAYEVAHYYPLVAERLGVLAALAWSIAVAPADPVTILGWLSLPAFWGSQVLLIVVGHVIAVVAAHAVAVERSVNLADARRTHLPLVALMVGYTVLSLWIISRPIVS